MEPTMKTASAPIKPQALIVKEAKEMLINGINYTIQQTQIPFYELEPIMKDLYDEVRANALQEQQQAEAQYKAELEAFEKENTPAEEVDTPVEVLN